MLTDNTFYQQVPLLALFLTDDKYFQAQPHMTAVEVISCLWGHTEQYEALGCLVFCNKKSVAAPFKKTKTTKDTIKRRFLRGGWRLRLDERTWRLTWFGIFVTPAPNLLLSESLSSPSYLSTVSPPPPPAPSPHLTDILSSHNST